MTVLDLLVEVLLVGFAVFTVVHLLGAELGWTVRTTGVLWLFLGAPAMAGFAWWGTRTAAAVPSPAPSPAPATATGDGDGRSVGLLVGTGFALLSALVGVMCAVSGAPGFTVFWALGLLLALVSVVAWSRGSGLARRPAPPPAPSALRTAGATASWAHVVALVLAVGLGVFVLFVLNPSRDDVYYVNRATWVAQHGTFPSRDTMFGPQTFPATYGAGLPVAALEEAYGSLARLFGIPAAGFVYLVANPVLAGLSVWSAWRLVRAWAPRRALLALVVAVAVPLFSGTGLVGDFGYAREWQGKVVVILLVMPLVWVHLTRLARGAPAAWSVAVLGVLGAAWCGLTVTAPIFGGVLAGVGLLGALLLPGVRRPLGLGALALLAAPLLTGVATVLTSKGPVAEENYVSEPALVWGRVLGTDLPVVALLGFALLVGPLLVRSREGRLLAALAGVVSLAMLVPGLFDVLEALTSTGPIALRLLFTAPWPVLVGLLVTVALPPGLARRGTTHLPGVVAAVVVLGLLVGTGTAVWSSGAEAVLASSPTWKVKVEARRHVEALLATDPGPGPVLLPAAEGRVLAIMSTRTFSVVPRDYYIQFVQEPQEQHRARYAFRRFVVPSVKDPVPPVLARALETLDVTLACVPEGARRQQAELRTIGLPDERRVGGMVCFDGPGTGTLPQVTPPVTPPAGRAPAR
ncbi:hypothetical protein GCM10009815_14350 [Nocardioides marmoribigeumensis]